jgi:hypothetical protein
LESSTRQLALSLPILQASSWPFFPFVRNISLQDLEQHLPWRNNRAAFRRVEGSSSSILFIRLTRFWILESLCFVRMVRCGNGILTSVHGRLTTSKTFTCIQSSNHITWCA